MLHKHHRSLLLDLAVSSMWNPEYLQYVAVLGVDFMNLSGVSVFGCNLSEVAITVRVDVELLA